MSIYSNESSNNLNKSKAQRLWRLKARLDVKQPLVKNYAIKNKSLSISTEKVRQSFKMLDQKERSSIPKLKINLLSDVSTMKNFKL